MSQLQGGDKLNEYSLIRCIGRGGMGRVFEAYEESLNRIVAIKVFLEEIGKNKTLIERFKQEARIVAALNHPNIVTIYRFVDNNDPLYIVMEHIDGDTFYDYMKQENRDLETLLGIFIQTGEGLTAAHKAGIIHRDLKLANLMVNTSGLVKILDFGLAKTISKEKTRLTSPRAVLGTLNYLAPELVRGEGVSFQSDIYALGIVFYIMLSGEVPFDADSPFKILENIKSLELPDLKTIKPDMPDTVCRIIHKMCAKDIKERYQTMEAVIVDLKKCSSKRGEDKSMQHHNHNKNTAMEDPIPEKEVQKVLLRAEEIEQTSGKAMNMSEVNKLAKELDISETSVKKAVEEYRHRPKPVNPLLKIALLGIIAILGLVLLIKVYALISTSRTEKSDKSGKELFINLREERK